MARTISVKTNPDALRDKITEYHELCDKQRKFYDYPGLLFHCGITRADVEQMTSERNAHHVEFTEIFEGEKLLRESKLVCRMVTEPKSAIGCMNALKQKDNGGYVDKAVNATEAQTLNINIVGGHGAELFK